MVLLVRGRDTVERPRPCGRGGAGNMAKPSKEEARALELVETASEPQIPSASTSRRTSLHSVSSSWSERTHSFMDKVMHRKKSHTDDSLTQTSSTDSGVSAAETEAVASS
ncbi:hypothetical protein TI39_contig407g00012 [Zymoseptoria brevis]|uniref:Uncharacterized protein n=1 Tax=Zymoseptoria brevis TaxID=1047168 RepID=A0A0F4GNA3_9PEZI|nr:hypothetical protein TI39_contig407g00012 [Zymoseptoria brevis]